MKHSLTIVIITARERSELGWLFTSIADQMCDTDQIKRIVVVDATCPHESDYLLNATGVETLHVPPKPTIWQGAHRVTREDWWGVSNARNTGLCLAETEWIAWIDDRCVLGPNSLQGVRDAMEGQYAVFAAYEKRWGMRVKDGVVIEPGELKATDGRLNYLRDHGMEVNSPSALYHGWSFGCGIACPVEWALTVGGFEQAVDGMGAEDYVFGMMLANHGREMRFDPRFFLMEDRTPEHCGKAYRREDKGVSPNDKSHRALELFGTAWQTTNRAQLWQSRAAVLRGERFPVLLDSTTDWWDGEVIDEDYFRR